MRHDDVWFEPGDKVMRVAYVDNILSDQRVLVIPCDPASEFGNVLCVSSCWIGRDGKASVSFIGIPDDSTEGYLAACFRRVSEIQLCVSAVRKPKTREGVEG